MTNNEKTDGDEDFDSSACSTAKGWDSIVEWANDPKDGHGTKGWNTRRFAVLSKSGGSNYFGLTVNEIMYFLLPRIDDPKDFRVEVWKP